jgi:hypothetical protein
MAQVEIAFNNSENRRMGKIPFEIVYGIQPRDIKKLRDLNQDEFISVGVEDFTTDM